MEMSQRTPIVTTLGALEPETKFRHPPKDTGQLFTRVSGRPEEGEGNNPHLIPVTRHCENGGVEYFGDNLKVLVVA